MQGNVYLFSHHSLLCIVVDCGSPGILANGTTDVTSDTTVGSIAEHSCDDHFMLCGSRNRTCKANGIWLCHYQIVSGSI